jgi:hypothetical protein
VAAARGGGGRRAVWSAVRGRESIDVDEELA